MWSANLMMASVLIIQSRMWSILLMMGFALVTSVAGCPPRSPPSGSLMAIGGLGTNEYEEMRSAEVLSTSCDFPLPKARGGHIGVTTADGKTLVCGGMTPSGYTPSCVQFDYETKSWQNHSSLLSQYRHYASAVVLSKGVYVLGGEGVSAGSSSEFLATGSSEWTQGPDIPGEGVYLSCAAKVSDTEFVILGANTPTQAILYNEVTDKWRRWTNLTEAVVYQSCVGLGDKLLMAGGWKNPYNPIDGQATGKTFVFDTKTGSAREVASLKYPRAEAAMVLYRGHPLILGGRDSSGVRSDGEMWNMDTETWEEANIHLNNTRLGFSLVNMAQKIFC